jgi:hypothetical protein
MISILEIMLNEEDEERSFSPVKNLNKKEYTKEEYIEYMKKLQAEREKERENRPLVKFMKKFIKNANAQDDK